MELVGTGNVDQAPFLAFEHISKRFGGVAALDDVSLAISAGEIHAIVGENGAGKSTLMKCLVGVHRPDSGSIRLAGTVVAPGSPAEARALGIDVVFQEIELAQNLTVAQSIFLAREPTRFGLIDSQRMNRESAAVLARLKLPIAPSALVESLRTAEMQGVQIARALLHGARVLIMDEPTSSLSDHEVSRLLELLESLRAGGTTILYVSHKLDEIFRLADTISVLRDGRHVATQPRSTLDADKMIALMAGPGVSDPAQAGPRSGSVSQRRRPPAANVNAGTDAILAASNLGRGTAFRDINFDLRKGEVLGLFGIVGAGRTELARALFGLEPYVTGELRLAGQQVRFTSAAQAVKAGLALVPEDRKLQGLLLEESLRSNVSLPCLGRLAPHGWIPRAQERALATSAVSQLHIAARAGIEQEARFLSGGNQQKVVLAKWLATRPRVLILDEPTKGIDVGSKAEVHAMVRRFAAEGMGVILISSELDEVLALSDRILVMRAGRVAVTLDSQAASREALLRYAVSA